MLSKVESLKKRFGVRGILLVVILIAIPVTVYLAQLQQEIRQRASEEPIDFYGRQVNVLKMFGQSDFTQTGPNAVTSSRLYHSSGVAVDRNSSPNKVYVADRGNNRILGFNGVGFCSNDASACTVNSDCGSGNTCQVDGTKPPDIVFGQADFTHGACNRDNNLGIAKDPTAETLCFLGYPEATNTQESWMRLNIDVDSQGNLYVIDFGNSRVLKYNSPFGVQGEGQGDTFADFVWGQDDFTTGGPNRGNVYGTISPPDDHSLNLLKGHPNSVSSYGISVDPEGNVWVADLFNHRILRFPPNSKNANLVLGQTTFTSNDYGGSCERPWDQKPLDKLCNPTLARVHPQTGDLYVLDEHGGFATRFLAYHQPFTNGMLPYKQFRVNQPGPLQGWPEYKFESTGFVFNPYKQGEYAEGEIWLNEHSANRTLLIDFDGNIVKVIGERDALHRGGDSAYNRLPGCGSVYEGFRLWWPGGSIGFDSENNMYLADEHFHRVARYGLPYALRQVGSSTCLPEPNGGLFPGGSQNTLQDSHLGTAVGMGVFQNQLIIQDKYAKLKIWNNYSGKTTGSSPDFVLTGTQMPSLSQLAVDPNGKLWMMNTSGQLQAYNLPLATTSVPLVNSAQLYWKDDGQPVTYRVGGVAFDPYNRFLYIADYSAHRVLRISDFSNPNHLEVDMVIGQRNKQDTRCNHDQDYGWKAAGPPTADSLCAPTHLAVDKLSNLYVVENSYECHGNDRITVFLESDLLNPSGSLFPNIAAQRVFVGELASRGPNGGYRCDQHGISIDQPASPVSIAFNSRNQMVIGNDGYYEQTLQQERHLKQLWFYNDPTAQRVPDASIALPMGAPGALVFDEENNLLVQDHTWNRVWMINLDRDPAWLSYNSGATPLPVPTLPPRPLPSPIATPSASPSPSPRVLPSPSPALPTPSVSPSPSRSPSLQPTPSPTVVPAPLPTPQTQCPLARFGDVNCDSSVDILDISITVENFGRQLGVDGILH